MMDFKQELYKKYGFDDEDGLYAYMQLENSIESYFIHVLEKRLKDYVNVYDFLHAPFETYELQYIIEDALTYFPKKSELRAMLCRKIRKNILKMYSVIQNELTEFSFKYYKEEMIKKIILDKIKEQGFLETEMIEEFDIIESGDNLYRAYDSIFVYEKEEESKTVKIIDENEYFRITSGLNTTKTQFRQLFNGGFVLEDELLKKAELIY
ncbi:hypothetical protein [Heyndrickxia oleronia]|uniref:hypothetical protein n=1 Tax=Heyndrickxia oleronia TaxID=38875 RepID=UPI00375209DF